MSAGVDIGSTLPYRVDRTSLKCQRSSYVAQKMGVCVHCAACSNGLAGAVQKSIASLIPSPEAQLCKSVDSDRGGQTARVCNAHDGTVPWLSNKQHSLHWIAEVTGNG